MEKIVGTWTLMPVSSIINEQRPDLVFVFSIPVEKANLIHQVAFQQVVLSGASQLASLIYMWGNTIPVSVTVDRLIEPDTEENVVSLGIRVSWGIGLPEEFDAHIVSTLSSSFEEFLEFLNTNERSNTIVSVSSFEEAERLFDEQDCVVSLPSPSLRVEPQYASKMIESLRKADEEDLRQCAAETRKTMREMALESARKRAVN